ncbi:MAG: TIGR00730 family Rossman fold protein [Verrucomicrobiota bacterium]|nr:TIGR00730 family Rossman fold protein [Verrucomicrobiota bacterium]
MADFTGGAINALPATTRSSGSEEFDERIKQLVEDWGCEKSCALIREMIVTALKMGRDNLTVADLKLFNRSLKELRYAARVFAPYAHVRKVVVFGSARILPDEPSYQAAQLFAQKMREQGYMIITGGGDGIMGAAQRGAGREDSFGLNIRLPFEQRANETIYGDTKLINFNYFFTRKLNFVKESHAVALFPGGFGTLDEGFEVLTLMQTGKARIIPLVLIDRPGGNYWKTWFSFLGEYLLKVGLVSENDFNLFTMTSDVDEAVAEIMRFYRNFRSYRWVGKRMVIRMQSRLTAEAVTKLNEDFRDLLVSGRIEQGMALPEEKNEPEIWDAPRLILCPGQRDFGRLRKLIDAVNEV